MRYYIIAGEASGDLHASNLMRELKKLDPDAKFRCWGGDKMQSEGAELVRHYRDLAFMGFTEVLMNLRAILRNIQFCKQNILEWKPDVLILVDYPGFNLRIAAFAKQHKIRIHYYISPQVWAWKQSRVEKIKRDVDRMFVILPFEKDFYQKFGMKVDFVGHPLLDALSQVQANLPAKDAWLKQHELDQRPVIALLPGSRKQEISIMLPLMLSITEQFPEYQFVIAGAPSLPREFYDQLLSGSSVKMIPGETYTILSFAHAALVTSGTATLETALFRVPEVVCYKGGKLSYYIARSLVKVPYISLVNLVMNREVVKELIQQELNSANLARELHFILDKDKRMIMQNDYAGLEQKLGGQGASGKTAAEMWNDIRGLKES